MARTPVSYEDLLKSGEAARSALINLTDTEWQAKPPNMTWTRLETVSHVCSALQGYATQLAAGTLQREARLQPDPNSMTSDLLPGLVLSGTRILAAVSRGMPPETRGWHSAGSPDPEGFLAMGCAEVLLHCWDVVNGTGETFEADDDLSEHTLRRLFPWSPANTPPWQTLLFATGRIELPVHESPGDGWGWHNAPLDEWDGKEVRFDEWVGR